MKTQPPSILTRSDGVLDRMKRASDKVEERLDRATAALTAAGVAYAVVGGNAIAAWVATVDESAVRMTRDVDVMVRRDQFDRVQSALTDAGFHYRRVAGIDVFLDSPNSKVGDGVHVVFAGEMVRSHEPGPNPDVDQVEDLGGVPYLALLPLVQIKLTAFRDKDRVHLRDLIGVGLVDEEWIPRLAEPLASRLKELLDDPNG